MIETIVQLLKSEDCQARVSLGDAWLYWDENKRAWVVCQKKYGKRKTTIQEFSNVDSEFDAVRELIRLQDK